jgi:hypothetical protein
MNAERPVLPAMAFVFAAAFTAFDAQAQAPRDCDGSNAGPATVAGVVDGQRWSDRFTATIVKRSGSAFVTPKALAARTIEVRGWIEERNGPAVEVTRPEQIEIIH